MAMNRSELLRHLNLNTFIAFDFETTGLDAREDRIIEIAAIRFEDGKPSERYVTLLNPGRPIPAMITDITGISDAMVAQAPAEEQIVDDFWNFLGDWPMVAHNTSFDHAFLTALAERQGKILPDRNYYDTLPLSRMFLFFQPNHNLSALSDFFHFSTDNAHRAEADTENCGQSFIELVAEAASYSLEVISRIVALLKHFDVFNKLLFIDLANTLTRSGDLKQGLIPSSIEKPVPENVFIHHGTNDIQNLDAETVLGADGYLSRSFSTYEERPNQVKYSRFVQEILEGEGGIGVVEAGTGLGKTMAYLFPALRYTLTNDDDYPLIISCYTKHLQDQLFNKDLPQLAEAIDVSLQAVVLKGRNNYLCQTRLQWLLGNAEKLLNREEAVMLLPILIWQEWTHTGDMDECPGFSTTRSYRLTSLIQSEPGFCSTQLCARNNGCYFGPLRRALFQANLIIINHALLISDVKSRLGSVVVTTGFLPPHDTIIIDEAHNIVKSAYNQLTEVLDQRILSFYLDHVDPQRTYSNRWNNQIKSLGELHPQFLKLRESLARDVESCRRTIKEFFEQLGAHIQYQFDPEAKYSKKWIIKNLTETFGPVTAELEAMIKNLNTVVKIIKDIRHALLEIDETRNDFPELHQHFDYGEMLLKESMRLVQDLTLQQDENRVYWFDGVFRNGPGGQLQFYVTIQGVPVDLAEDLTGGLFKVVRSAVLTSATLRTEESFDYFLRRVGLDQVDFKETQTAIFESPFLYEEQVRYYQYSRQDGQRPEVLASLIYNLHKTRNKRILTLFTSRDSLNKTLRELRSLPEGNSLPIFAQQRGTSRQGLIRGMGQVKNGILLGTNAFWEGIDFPGELLEILIITKLPFDVPDEPVIRAYGQLLESQGGNRFLDFGVPEAIIRFRQGFGRLIRTTYDEGLFINMDGRVVNKPYGVRFSDAIPVKMTPFSRVEEILS
ncbi:MAG: helicase C-terminal domain-containing protein [Fidelibacterota bacterium]